MECWRPSMIMAIAAEAGKPISLDAVTERQRKRGFARVKLELDAGRPLKPGVVVQAGDSKFWQQFQFENLPAVCFLCGVVGHLEGECPCLSPGEAREGGGRMPRFGPWISTSRIRQPRVAADGGARRAGPSSWTDPSSSGPGSSSPGSKPGSSSSPPGSPPDSDGWQKPAKVARRARGTGVFGGPSGRKEGGLGGASSGEQAFAPLARTGECMEEEACPMPAADSRMLEPDQPLLKRPRSPPRCSSGQPAAGPVVLPQAPVPLKASKVKAKGKAAAPGSAPGSTSVIPAGGQVCLNSPPCMPLDAPAEEGFKGEEEVGVRDAAEGMELVLVPIGEGDAKGVRGHATEKGGVGAERNHGVLCLVEAGAAELGKEGGNRGGSTVTGGLRRDKGKGVMVPVEVREAFAGSREGALIFSSSGSSMGGGAGRPGSVGKGRRGAPALREGVAGGRPGHPGVIRRGAPRGRSLGGTLDRSRSRSPSSAATREGREEVEGGAGSPRRRVEGLEGHRAVVEEVWKAMSSLPEADQGKGGEGEGRD